MNIFIFVWLLVSQAWGQDVTVEAPEDTPPPTESMVPLGFNHTRVVVIAPEYPHFDHPRPKISEDCQAATAQILMQGLPETQLTTLCGEGAKKTKILEALNKAADGATSLTIFWSGHALNLGDVEEMEFDPFLVPADGYDPGLETHESLISVREALAAVHETNPNLKNVVWWFDTIQDNRQDPELIGLHRVKWDQQGLPAQTSVYTLVTLPDPPQNDSVQAMESTLLKGIQRCWVPDDERIVAIKPDAENRLTEAEFESCVLKSAKDPAIPWSGMLASGMTRRKPANVVNVLYNWGWNWDPPRSGPVLRPWMGIAGGYGFGAGALGLGLVAQNNYMSNYHRLSEPSFQGTPDERELLLSEMSTYRRQIQVRYGVAGTALAVTTGYATWQLVKHLRQNNANNNEPPALSYWFTANQQQSQIGFTYRF